MKAMMKQMGLDQDMDDDGDEEFKKIMKQFGMKKSEDDEILAGLQSDEDMDPENMTDEQLLAEIADHIPTPKSEALAIRERIDATKAKMRALVDSGNRPEAAKFVPQMK